jgi:hypothetical protein
VISNVYRRGNSFGRIDVRDIYEVLKQKEMEIQKLTKEVEALRTAINVLEAAEEGTAGMASTRASVSPINAPSVVKNNEAPLPTPRLGMTQFP